jgi:hypothetical protein
MITRRFARLSTFSECTAAFSANSSRASHSDPLSRDAQAGRLRKVKHVIYNTVLQTHTHIHIRASTHMHIHVSAHTIHKHTGEHTFVGTWVIAFPCSP